MASTFLNSASTTAQASPSQGTSDGSDYSEQFPAGAATEQAKVVQEAKQGTDTTFQSTSSTDLEGAQSTEQYSAGEEKVSKRESGGSIKASSRRGSTASSKLSEKDKPALPATSQEEKAVALESSNPTEKPRKSGFSRFFSVLNCCSAPKDANTSESTQVVPPKKAKTLQTNRGRQSTPMAKPDASAGESSKTESKEAIEDKIAGPPYSELTPAAKPKIIESPKKQPPIMETSPIPNESVPSADPKPMPAQPTPSDQPLPPLPPNDKDTTTNSYDAFDEKSAGPSTDEFVESPIPPTTAIAEEEGSKEASPIDDRTPQQEARDIEMPDAPPVPEQAAQQEAPAPSPPQTALPPPPPISTPSRPAASDRQASNGATTDEQQKWLLPPIADRFKGKKCLVLDLDETLVHSSFKVGA